MVGLQVQGRGQKHWRIQSALPETQLAASPFAGLRGDRNVVYTGDVCPGDMLLLWPVSIAGELFEKRRSLTVCKGALVGLFHLINCFLLICEYVNLLMFPR